jgi:hypothetical protein
MPINDPSRPPTTAILDDRTVLPAVHAPPGGDPADLRLRELEDVIERGLATFVEVGEALLEIRDTRLYRATHATFEAYCRDRWRMGREYAHRLIEASQVVSLLPVGNTVSSERVARELVPVLRRDPVSLPAVLDEAAERCGAGPVTAAAVRAVVRERLRTMAAESEADIREATADWTEAQRDALSADRMRRLGELRRLVRDLAALPDPDTYADAFARWLTPEFREEASAAERWLAVLLTRLEATR